MKGLTSRPMNLLYMAILVNLFLWLAVGGAVWSSASVEDHVKYCVAAGTILAAILQHWAYYNLRRKFKQSIR